MKPYLFLCLCFSLSLVACSDKNEPDPEPTPANRLSAIFGPDDREEFQYDESGDISRWTLRASDSDVQTNYSYPDSDLIRVVTMYTVKATFPEESDSRDIYDEMMHLNSDGLVEYTEGKWTSYKGTDVISKKKYRLEFVYDGDTHLTDVNHSEWMQSGDGWAENPWTWTNTLEWEDGLLVKYTDYLGNSQPYKTVEYSYYGRRAVVNSPLVAPLIRRDYIPLQRAGIFGKQPLALFDKVTTEWEDAKTSFETYSYTLSTTSQSSWIESYSVKYNDENEKIFRVKWE